MDDALLSKAVRQVAEIIVDYNTHVDKFPVTPVYDAGFTRMLISKRLPHKPENLDDILRDVKNLIIPGLVHWNHPQFYAYFPAGNGYPSILAEMIITSLGCLGYNWSSCPALTELEIMTVDMFGRVLNLPSYLLYEESNGQAGGLFSHSASLAIYECMLVARTVALDRLKHDGNPMSNVRKLCAYYSQETHSGTEKAAYLQLVNARPIEINPEDDSVNVQVLEQTIKKDIEKGLVPFFVLANIGTTGTTAIDDIQSISQMLKKYPGIWFHIDGAYGGNALMLPQYQPIIKGVDNIDSINVNSYKWALTAPDGATYWTRNRRAFVRTFSQEQKYSATDDVRDIDLRSVSIGRSRRFRCLRLWFTMRVYGKKRLREYIANHVALAKYFENLIKYDRLFVLMNKVHFALVAFRVRETICKTSEELTKELLALCNESGRVHLTPTRIKGFFAIRFVVNYEFATKETVDYAWNLMKLLTEHISFDSCKQRDHLEMHSFVLPVEPSDKSVASKSIDFDSIIDINKARRHSTLSSTFG